MRKINRAKAKVDNDAARLARLARDEKQQEEDAANMGECEGYSFRSVGLQMGESRKCRTDKPPTDEAVGGSDKE